MAIAARNELLKKSIHIGIFSVPYVNAIDVEELKKISLNGNLLVLEEHYYKGGLGSEILETMHQFKIPLSVKIVGSKRNNPSQIGDRDYLLAQNGITVESVIDFFSGSSKD